MGSVIGPLRAKKARFDRPLLATCNRMTDNVTTDNVTNNVDGCSTDSRSVGRHWRWRHMTRARAIARLGRRSLAPGCDGKRHMMREIQRIDGPSLATCDDMTSDNASQGSAPPFTTTTNVPVSTCDHCHPVAIEVNCEYSLNVSACSPVPCCAP